MTDVIVVGVGGMGSAVACHIARRGVRVLALERHAIGHDLGSSHGLTRIIRLAYFEHPSYVPLLRRAFTLWRELEAATGQRLLHQTGALDIGRPGGRVLEGSLQSCTIHGLRHEVLDAAEVGRRFPAYALPMGMHALLQPDGGFLEPERCIAAHVALARAHGADVRTGTRVHAWHAEAGGVRVEFDGGSATAGQLVLCAGAWTPALAPQVAPILAPERQVVAWLGIRKRAEYAPERFPVFVMEADQGTYYGFPEHGAPGFKLGRYHHRHEAADPERLDRHVTDADIAVLREFAVRHFPSGAGEPLRSSVCLFTNTPDEHFILDRLPGAPAVLLVSACSGHGFKFCTVVGEIAADLVTRGATAHDIGLHALSRFRSRTDDA